MQNLETIVQSIKALPKYQDTDDVLINEVVEDCAYLYIRLRRCSEDVVFTSSELNWIKRASKEYLNKVVSDIPFGVKLYSESVYKLEFDGTTISQSLLDEVTPLAKVGYLSKKDVENVEVENENHENTSEDNNNEENGGNENSIDNPNQEGNPGSTQEVIVTPIVVEEEEEP